MYRSGTWVLPAASALGVLGAVTGLVDPGLGYGAETAELRTAALAQDLVMLVVVAPLVAVLVWRGTEQGEEARLLRLGVSLFLAYNYAIYCFSIQLGPLFLLWVAVLGLSVASVVVDVARLHLDPRASAPGSRLAGWVLLAVSTAFALLWLSEIVPDVLAGRPSTSATSWDVPTSPVHVLDLAIFLPAAALAGVLTLRGRHAGVVTAPGLLVFLCLTCVPILATPVVQIATGDEARWGSFGPVLGLLLLCLTALWSCLPTARSALAHTVMDEQTPR